MLGTWAGIRTVTVLELRQRLRSTRWAVVLAVWTVLLGALCVLIRYGVNRAYADGAEVMANDVAAQSGRTTFGVIVFLVLGLAGLVAPALSATSVNGDRQAGVLATLQTTLLTPIQLVLGKLLASWLTALALLAAALPFLLWVAVEAGTSPARLAGTLTVLALSLLVVCAIGLGWSAVTARTSSSAVLTYLTVSLLGPGLPLLFALSLPIVTEPTRVTVNAPGVGSACRTVQEERTQTFTNRTWWLLAPSPFVVVADAAPLPAASSITDGDPLTAIQRGVREARLGPDLTIEECTAGFGDAERAARAADLGPVWPVGLGILLAIGAGFTTVAVRRVRTPTRRLPAGTRVA